jgi:hypothetical protein
MKVQPGKDQGYYTAIHSAYLDAVMPLISGNAWKVLSAILRQTVGWQCQSVLLSQRVLLDLTGIRSHHTLENALNELRDFTQGDIPAPLINVIRGSDKWTPTEFSLNREVVIEWSPTAKTAAEPTAKTAAEPTAKTAAEPTAKTAAEPTAKTAAFNRKVETCLTEEREEKKHAASRLSNSRSTALGDSVSEVFDHWKTALSHPRAVLDAKREKAILARLKDGFSVADLKAAVDGCKADPFSMGQNDRNQVYDDIALICRDASHVEKFIRKASGVSNGSGGVNGHAPQKRKFCGKCDSGWYLPEQSGGYARLCVCAGGDTDGY